jgi:hypothetical protein
MRNGPQAKWAETLRITEVLLKMMSKPPQRREADSSKDIKMSQEGLPRNIARLLIRNEESRVIVAGRQQGECWRVTTRDTPSCRSEKDVRSRTDWK